MKTFGSILLVVVVGAMGCGDGTGVPTAPGANSTSVTAGNVGDRCGSSGDCKLFGGVSAICMKETFGGDVMWWNGYCTFGCNTKNPKCPEGRVCIEWGMYLDDARCLQPCGDNSDCRPGYECSLGVCVPGEDPPPPSASTPCSSANCTGCCDDDGKCQPGDTNAVCGNKGGPCYVCDAQEQCTAGSYYTLCYCRNGCEGGCCDPVTGACMPGTSDGACGDLNFQCKVCAADETCALYTSSDGYEWMDCVPK